MLCWPPGPPYFGLGRGRILSHKTSLPFFKLPLALAFQNMLRWPCCRPPLCQPWGCYKQKPHLDQTALDWSYKDRGFCWVGELWTHLQLYSVPATFQSSVAWVRGAAPESCQLTYKRSNCRCLQPWLWCGSSGDHNHRSWGWGLRGHSANYTSRAVRYSSRPQALK